VKPLDPQKAYSQATNCLSLLTAPAVALRPTSHPVLALARLAVGLGIDMISKIDIDAGAKSDDVRSNELAQKVLDDTIRLADTSARALAELLERGHPVRAIALAELGRLFAVDEYHVPPTSARGSAIEPPFPPHGPARLKLAYTTLLRALEELRIGFGAADGGGEAGVAAREMIARLEKEMDIWRDGVNRLRDEQLLESRKSARA
jgi:hypothetical protein